MSKTVGRVVDISLIHPDLVAEAYLKYCAEKGLGGPEAPENFAEEAARVYTDDSGINDEKQREKDLDFLTDHGCLRVAPEKQEERRALQQKALKAYFKGELRGNYLVDSLEGIDGISNNRKLRSLLTEGTEYDAFIEKWKQAAAGKDEAMRAELYKEALDRLVASKDEPEFQDGMSDEQLIEAYPKLNAIGRSCADIVGALDNGLLVRQGLLTAEENQQYKETVNRMYDRHSAGLNRVRQLANLLYPYIDDTPVQNLSLTDYTKFAGYKSPASYMSELMENTRSRRLTFLSDVNSALRASGLHAEQCRFYDLEGNHLRGGDVDTMQLQGRPMYVADPSQPDKGPMLLCCEPGIGCKVGEEARQQLQGLPYKKGQAPGTVACFLYKYLPGLAKLFYSNETLQDLRCWTNKQALAKSEDTAVRDAAAEKIGEDVRINSDAAITAYNEKNNKYKRFEHEARAQKGGVSSIREAYDELQKQKEEIDRNLAENKLNRQRTFSGSPTVRDPEQAGRSSVP